MYNYYIRCTSQSSKETNMKFLNSYCTQKCVEGIVDGKLQCHCGEDIEIFDWYWSKSDCSANTSVSDNNREILFHPLYSSGTAAVRGDKPFRSNRHHYWEVKMISNLYGTDVMVGVGTSEIELSEWKFRFCSMLGLGAQSWGYSYHGTIQHNNLVRQYGTQFGLGSIVGVHLDMCKGTLEYYVNRKPMGIAFTNLKGRELYPMVSSTAAQSAVRIICAVSEKPTLQLSCLKFISKNPALYKRYKEIPGLTRIYERKYFWIVPVNDEEEKKRMAELEEDLLCPLNYANFMKRNKKFRTVRWMPPDIRNYMDEVPTLSEEEDSSDDCCNFQTSQQSSTDDDDDEEDDLYKGLILTSAEEEETPSTSQQGTDQESRTMAIQRTIPSSVSIEKSSTATFQQTDKSLMGKKIVKVVQNSGAGEP